MNNGLPDVPAPGVDPLAGLHGYRLPEALAWWPPAPGWWVLAMLLLAAAAVAVAWFIRRRRCTAAARLAERELSQLQHHLRISRDTQSYVRGLSRLLRRYVLAVFPRHEVAALTGDAWLVFLDAHGGGGRFAGGPGRMLVEAPYRPAADVPADQLAALIADWIRHNREACR